MPLTESRPLRMHSCTRVCVCVCCACVCCVGECEISFNVCVQGEITEYCVYKYSVCVLR